MKKRLLDGFLPGNFTNQTNKKLLDGMIHHKEHKEYREREIGKLCHECTN